jgi:hypothetical protein
LCVPSCGFSSFTVRCQRSFPSLRPYASTTKSYADAAGVTAGWLLAGDDARGASDFAEGTALVRITRSSHTTGVLLPTPGTSIFQRTFFVSLHSTGGFASGASPVASGPRHCGQYRASLADARGASEAARSSAGTVRVLLRMQSSCDVVGLGTSRVYNACTGVMLDRMTRDARLMWGITLVTVPTIVFGGLAVLGVITTGTFGLPGPANLTQTQVTFYRAGHAHAGVLVILSLLLQLGLDHVRLPRGWIWPLRIAAPAAAILVSGGFFAAAHVPELIVILYLGAAVLTLATLAVGLGLIHARSE